MSKSIWRLMGVFGVLSLFSVTGYAQDVTLSTQCILVRDADLFGSNPSTTGESGTVPTSATEQVEACKQLSADAVQPGVSADLIGTGDLIIAVGKTEFENVVNARKSTPGQFLLFLNGVALPNDAIIVGREQIDDTYVLRYPIRQPP